MSVLLSHGSPTLSAFCGDEVFHEGIVLGLRRDDHALRGYALLAARLEGRCGDSLGGVGDFRIAP